MGKKSKELYKPLNKMTREEKMELMVQVIMDEGDSLGNDIIKRIDLWEIDTIEVGIMAVGLAKAVAFAKDVAQRTGVNFDKLYQKELRFYRKVKKVKE